VYAAMMGELNRDENERRKGLRWCFLALAALSLCEGNAEEMDEALRECEAALGVPNDPAMPRRAMDARLHDRHFRAVGISRWF
jgi:hypothetical protein